MIHQLRSRRLAWDRYDLIALALILLMVAVRLSLSILGFPGTDSEEGTMGLMALHIAQGKDWPIFYYGQNYMGAGEAYVGALMFHLFGVSLLSLRLGMVLFLVVFMVGIYRLASLLYGKKVALVSLFLLSIGARFVITPEMRAVGGAVETLVFGTLSLLLASWLAITSLEERQAAWKRWLGYAGWGLVCGLGLWSQWLVIPFLFVSFLLLAFSGWREWVRSPVLFFLLVGLLVGAYPLIVYNLHALPGEDSIHIFIISYQHYSGGAPTGLALFVKKLEGTSLYSLPMATSMTAVCPLTSLPVYGGGHHLHAYECALLYEGWSVSYMALLLYAIVVTVRPLWKLLRLRQPDLSTEVRRMLTVHMARSIVLLGGLFTLLPYTMSTAAAQRPQSMRYLVGLLIITPALVWPLMGPLLTRVKRRWPLPGWRPVVLALLLIAFVVGTAYDVTVIPDATGAQQNYYTLIDTLSYLHVKHVYSGYWVCDRLTFASQERVICATVDADLRRSATLRYGPYYEQVQADSFAAYVFTDQNGQFADPGGQHSLDATHHYQRVEVPGFVIYIKKQ